jgi:hypothetical protein
MKRTISGSFAPSSATLAQKNRSRKQKKTERIEVNEITIIAPPSLLSPPQVVIV